MKFLAISLVVLTLTFGLSSAVVIYRRGDKHDKESAHHVIQLYVYRGDNVLGTFDETVEFCNRLNGKLPIFHTQQDIDFLADVVLKPNSGYHPYATWIGMKRYGDGKDCRWIDHSERDGDVQLPWGYGDCGTWDGRKISKCDAAIFNNHATMHKNIYLDPCSFKLRQVCIVTTVEEELDRDLNRIVKLMTTTNKTPIVLGDGDKLRLGTVDTDQERKRLDSIEDNLSRQLTNVAGKLSQLTERESDVQFDVSKFSGQLTNVNENTLQVIEKEDTLETSMMNLSDQLVQLAKFVKSVNETDNTSQLLRKANSLLQSKMEKLLSQKLDKLNESPVVQSKLDIMTGNVEQLKKDSTVVLTLTVIVIAIGIVAFLVKWQMQRRESRKSDIELRGSNNSPNAEGPVILRF